MPIDEVRARLAARRAALERHADVPPAADPLDATLANVSAGMRRLRDDVLAACPDPCGTILDAVRVGILTVERAKPNLRLVIDNTRPPDEAA